MRRIGVFGLVSVLAALASGCATAIPYTYQEHCAFDGMKLQGVQHSHGQAMVYSQGHLASGHSYGTGVSCEIPKTDADKAEVNHIREAAQPKADYNRNIGPKRLLTGVGYVLWILPGIGAKLYYDSQYDKAVEASQQRYRTPASLNGATAQ